MSTTGKHSSRSSQGHQPTHEHISSNAIIVESPQHMAEISPHGSPSKDSSARGSHSGSPTNQIVSTSAGLLNTFGGDASMEREEQEGCAGSARAHGENDGDTGEQGHRGTVVGRHGDVQGQGRGEGHDGRDVWTPISTSSGGVSMAPFPDYGRISATGSESNVVYIKQERERPNADPNRAAFLNGTVYSPYNHAAWEAVLAHVETLTFVVDSLADVQYFVQILGSPNLPRIYAAVRTVSLPGFHWFSGIMHNRLSNPSIEMVKKLPNLQELSLTFHTAGLTHSRWGERERIRLEETDLEKSKELQALRLGDIVRKYDLQQFFGCTKLKTLHLECLNSPMVQFFSKTEDPLAAFRELQHFFETGFGHFQGAPIFVDQRVIDI